MSSARNMFPERNIRRDMVADARIRPARMMHEPISNTTECSRVATSVQWPGQSVFRHSSGLFGTPHHVRPGPDQKHRHDAEACSKRRTIGAKENLSRGGCVIRLIHSEYIETAGPRSFFLLAGIVESISSVLVPIMLDATILAYPLDHQRHYCAEFFV